jgi:hypothetical protein
MARNVWAQIQLRTTSQRTIPATKQIPEPISSFFIQQQVLRGSAADEKPKTFLDFVIHSMPYLPAMSPQDDLQSESTRGRVASPFAQTEVTLPAAPRRLHRTILWITLGVALMIAGGLGGTYVTRFLNDPLRTMEALPAGKYFDNYHSLAGAKFKGELRVEADLGWKEGVGRMMLFSTPADSRPIAVFIPGNLANIYFIKGQTYLAELEVKEGGLVYANSCKKN